MNQFDASKYRAAEPFKKNSTSFSSKQQPRSYASIFGKLFKPTDPTASSAPPQSIQSALGQQQAPITPLGRIGEKLPVSTKAVSPGIVAGASLAEAVQKQVAANNPPASAIMQPKPATASFSAPDQAALASMISSLQVPGAGAISSAARPATNNNPAIISGPEDGSAIAGGALNPPAPPKQPAPLGWHWEQQGDGWVQVMDAPARVLTADPNGGLSADELRPDAYGNTAATIPAGSVMGGRDPYLDPNFNPPPKPPPPEVGSFMPSPDDARLTKINDLYNQAGQAATEGNSRAANAIANRMRQTGGTGSISVINAMLDENDDELFSANAQSRSANEISRASSLATETMNIFNQKLDTFWDGYNAFIANGDLDGASVWLGAGMEQLAETAGFTPEQVQVMKDALEFAEWTDSVGDDIDAAFETSGATNESVAKSLVGRKDSDGNALTYEAALKLVNRRRSGVAAPTTQPAITYGSSASYQIRPDGSVYSSTGQLIGTDNGFGVLIGVDGKELGTFVEPISGARSDNGSKLVYIEQMA